MSVNFIPWTNRLSRLMREPGGILAADAVAKAEENLLAVRDDCLAAIDRHLHAIETLHADAARRTTAAVKDEIYALSNEVHALAGVFGLDALGHAAFSLCELVDRMRIHAVWREDAVAVHLNALRLLRHPEQAPAPEIMLEGLRRVTDTLPKPAAG